MMSDDLQEIIERIKARSFDEADIMAIAAAIQAGHIVLAAAPGAISAGGNVTNSQLTSGNENVVGDGNTVNRITIYGADAETIQSALSQLGLGQASAITSADELVQQVRSRLHDNIQDLHGTMPLWGIDHWVPLGELFVDVNILEELSSSRRSEAEKLLQNFSKNPSYRSLDRTFSRLINTENNIVGRPHPGSAKYALGSASA